MTTASVTTGLLATLMLTALAGATTAQPSGSAGATQPLRLAQARAVPPVLAEDELSPRQIQQANPPRPARAARPAAAPPAADAPATSATTAPKPAASGVAAARPAGAAARTIACSGVFGRDSTHLKLAIAFDSKNLAFTEVDGPEGTKLNASVLFPNDPKRRLEVLWQNEAARADTALIVVGGPSQWSGPKGLRIGMPLAALEKANGKPFSLSGLDQGNGGSVLDWHGGAMSSLPGGCKVGVRLAADPKAKDDARAAVAGKELKSNDAALRAARLSISEFIIGYSE